MLIGMLTTPKDGYTMEVLDVYGMNENEEGVLVHGVRPSEKEVEYSWGLSITGICRYISTIVNRSELNQSFN